LHSATALQAAPPIPYALKNHTHLPKTPKKSINHSPENRTFAQLTKQIHKLGKILPPMKKLMRNLLLTILTTICAIQPAHLFAQTIKVDCSNEETIMASFKEPFADDNFKFEAIQKYVVELASVPPTSTDLKTALTAKVENICTRIGSKYPTERQATVAILKRDLLLAVNKVTANTYRRELSNMECLIAYYFHNDFIGNYYRRDLKTKAQQFYGQLAASAVNNMQSPNTATITPPPITQTPPPTSPSVSRLITRMDTLENNFYILKEANIRLVEDTELRLKNRAGGLGWLPLLWLLALSFLSWMTYMGLRNARKDAARDARTAADQQIKLALDEQINTLVHSKLDNIKAELLGETSVLRADAHQKETTLKTTLKQELTRELTELLAQEKQTPPAASAIQTPSTNHLETSSSATDNAYITEDQTVELIREAYRNIIMKLTDPDKSPLKDLIQTTIADQQIGELPLDDIKASINKHLTEKLASFVTEERIDEKIKHLQNIQSDQNLHLQIRELWEAMDDNKAEVMQQITKVTPSAISSNNTFTTEIEALKERVSQLELENAQLKTILETDNAQDSLGEDDDEYEPKIHTQSATPITDDEYIFYAALPTEGLFLSKKLYAENIPGRTFYKVVISELDANIASYTLTDDKENLAIAFNVPESYLQEGCQITGTNAALNIEQFNNIRIRPGQLRKDNGNWRITKKITIEA
jgi:hypothetical protein